MSDMKWFTVKVPLEFHGDLEQVAKKFGLPVSTLGGMCLQAGFVAVIDQLERISRAKEFTQKAVKPVRRVVRDKEKEMQDVEKNG